VNDEGTQVRTLLQNIEVLSAGTSIQKDAEGKPSSVRVVNLLVTPEDAQILGLAAGLGGESHIQLVLRNPLDTQVAQVRGTGMGQLFSGGKPANVERHGGKAAAERASEAGGLHN
jgi:pilus assembly protein CpaB